MTSVANRLNYEKPGENVLAKLKKMVKKYYFFNPRGKIDQYVVIFYFATQSSA